MRTARGEVPTYGYERIPLDLFAIGIVFFVSVNLGRLAIAGAALCLMIMLASRWKHLFRLASANWILLTLPVFAIASAAWSDLPAISLKYGIQLLGTILMGLIIAGTVPLVRFPVIVWAGTSIACVLGMLSGNVGPSAEGLVLIGLSGSKNHFAYVSLFWLLSSLAIFVDGRQNWMLRVAGAACVLPAAYLVYQANATTALLSAGFGASLLLVLAVFKWLPTGFRVFCTILAFVIGAALTAAAPQISQYAERARSDLLEKDETLTGRTILWDHADRLIAKEPLIGHGYKSVWFGEEGTGILGRFEKTDPRGFNFHDTFREIVVDLGYVGLFLFAFALAAVGIKLVGVLVLWPGLNANFPAAIALTIVLRMKMETVIGPVGLDVVLLFASFSYVWAMPWFDEARAARPRKAKSQEVAPKRPASVRPARPVASFPARSPVF